MAASLKVRFPPKLRFLFEKYRYKVMYSGRGTGKSWSIARALLILGARQPVRVLCVRELQKSIKDSVHRLLSDQIELMELGPRYTIQDAKIVGVNGTEFFFEGLRLNAPQIKSYEGVDICWVEEAALVSKSSWEILVPTIRKDGSEIWVSFNPEFEEDETYQRFVLNPPSNAYVERLHCSDNPWFPDVLRIEMEDCKRRDPDAYLNIWEGHCRQSLTGAIYAKELRESQEAKRICNVPYNPAIPVDCAWDLGWADYTSIWFVQKVGLEYHLIDFYQGNQMSISEHLKEIQKKPYVFGVDYLPHDAKQKQLGTGKSVQDIMKGLGRKVREVPKLSVFEGINAVKTMFPAMYIDSKKCSDGLFMLRRYKYKENSDGRLSKDPDHDEYSHASDALRYYAVGHKTVRSIIMEKDIMPSRKVCEQIGWMG